MPPAATVSTRSAPTLASCAQTREETAGRRATLDGHLAALDAALTDRADFERLLADGRTFLATVRERKESLQAEDDALSGPLYQTFAEQRLVREEVTHLRGRRDLIPADLDRFRNEAAQASGLAPADLPFVAELVDVHPDHGEWRSAIELALGGFAVTMLVPADRVGAVRRAVNAMRWARRVKFEAAGTGLPHTPADDPARLPGRLTIAESPFTGWLSGRLADRFNFTCVDDPADLDHVTAGLTITGQTRSGTQGAHGGNDRHRPIIGFSPQARLDQLAARDTELNAQLAALQGARDDLRAQIRNLDERATAHNAVAATAWDSVDVARVDASIDALQTEQTKLLDGSDALRVAQERVLLLTAAVEAALGAKQRQPEGHGPRQRMGGPRQRTRTRSTRRGGGWRTCPKRSCPTSTVLAWTMGSTPWLTRPPWKPSTGTWATTSGTWTAKRPPHAPGATSATAPCANPSPPTCAPGPVPT